MKFVQYRVSPQLRNHSAAYEFPHRWASTKKSNQPPWFLASLRRRPRTARVHTHTLRAGGHDVLVGAVMTALLFTVGKFLIGLYLGRSAVASSYGAAGALIVVLLWVYYSAQIFLLGAEFTKIYASRRGTPAAIRAVD